MATYLMIFDVRNPTASTDAAVHFSEIGATELWPGTWVFQSDLSGASLREHVKPLSDQQGFLLIPFTGAKTSAAGLHSQAPQAVRHAFAELIARPILKQSEPMPFDPLEQFKKGLSGGLMGVGTLDD